jgi:hypothetical protein
MDHESTLKFCQVIDLISLTDVFLPNLARNRGGAPHRGGYADISIYLGLTKFFGENKVTSFQTTFNTQTNIPAALDGQTFNF